MVFDRSLCHIPPETVLDENGIRCRGDVIFSDRSSLKRNLITEGRIFMGEFVEVEGDIISIGDIRIDKGTKVQGNITGDSDIFIGERCIIAGELVVGRNLEIGEGVEVDPKAIDSKGRVNIRNPISVIVYILLYILDLIRKNDSQEVENFFKELEDGEEENFLISQEFTYFPRGTKVTRTGFHIPGNMKISSKCQVIGDIEVTGSLDVEEEVQIFGDISSKGDVFIGENTIINGRVKSDGRVDIHHAARITGDVKGSWIFTTSDTIIDGTLKGEEGIRIQSEGSTAIEERLERFEKGVDRFHGLVD